MIVLLNYAVMLKLLPEPPPPHPLTPCQSPGWRQQWGDDVCWEITDWPPTGTGQPGGAAEGDGVAKPLLSITTYKSNTFLHVEAGGWGAGGEDGSPPFAQTLAVIAQSSHQVCLKIIHNLMLLSDPCLGFLHTNSAVGDKGEARRAVTRSRASAFLPTCLFS